jgi:hypothetical protein
MRHSRHALPSICWNAPTCVPSNCCLVIAAWRLTARYLRIATTKVCVTTSPLDLLPRPVAAEPKPAAPQHSRAASRWIARSSNTAVAESFQWTNTNEVPPQTDEVYFRRV